MPGFNPDQPRDKNGQWTDEGTTTVALRRSASDINDYKKVELKTDEPEILKASMENWFNEELPKLEEGIDIRNNTERYTTGFFKDFNSNLYNNRELSPEQKEADDKLQKLFQSAPKVRGEVYRGMKFTNEQAYKNFKRDLSDDGEITFKGYMSTTIDLEVTRRAKFQGSEEVRWSAEFRIKGKNGVYIQAVSSVPDEEEVLFNRGTKIKTKKYSEIIDENNHVKLIIEGEEL